MSATIPFGNYELVERIGEGGMAEVWRALSRGVAGFEKTVVIKRVLPTLLERPGFAELLIREAKIAARLSHPNIAQIYDLGEQQGSYFIAMEHVSGRDLAAALGHRPVGETPLDLPLRLWIGAEVAKALDFAHRAEGDDGKPLLIVHRDVSPQNVLLGYEGEVKVADFGIARADEPGLGRGDDPNILRGKYAYMSPEQARGEALDHRSDIFSFGILLYEAVCRRRMYRGRTTAETLAMVRSGKLPDYRRDLLLPDLEPVLAGCLAPAREDRFESAGEVYELLSRLLFGLNSPVGAPDLARAMQALFPREDRGSPNKLRVDLLTRAIEDASSERPTGLLSTAIPTPADDARTPPASPNREPRLESRGLVAVAIEERVGDDALVMNAVSQAGGTLCGVQDGVHFAAFGVAGLERAGTRAVRCALEIRRRSRLEGPARLDSEPLASVVLGRGGFAEGELVRVEPETLAEAARLLWAADRDGVFVSGGLLHELSREFRCRRVEGGVRIEGFRARGDRDAGELRDRSPLVGREPAMRSLSRLLLDASQGKGAIVHLVGEPGVGKSRLLAELRASAAPQNFVFLRGRANEGKVPESFSALADLVTDLCGLESDDSPAERHAKVDRLGVLGLVPREVRMLGELVGLAYPVSSRERAGRPRGIELALLLRKAIRTLARDRVVVVALEDLQWMNDAMRQVLPLLVARLDEVPVIVLVTRRHGDQGPSLPGSQSIDVSPLDAHDTGRLVAHWLGLASVEPEVAQWVRDETGGIPAWIEVLAESQADRLIDEEGVARLPAEGALELPVAVRTSVAARTHRLRPLDLALLRITAALDSAAEVHWIAAVEGLVGHTERPAIRRLLARRLLVPAASGLHPDTLGAWGGDEGDERLPTRVRLSSTLLRRGVLAELDEDELVRLSSRIVATLERIGVNSNLGDLERLARHAERGRHLGAALDYSARCGVLATSLGEYDAASRHFARACELCGALPRGGEVDRTWQLGLAWAESALRAGHTAGVRAALEALDASLAAEPTVEQRASRAAIAARMFLRSSRPLEALEALASVPTAELDRTVRGAFARLAGWAHLDAGQGEEALAAFSASLDEEDPDAQGRAAAYRAVALARADRLDEADAAVRMALAGAARTGTPELRRISLAAMAFTALARGDANLAARSFAHSMALTGTEPDGLRLAFWMVMSAFAAAEARDPSAETRSRAALAGARASGHVGLTEVASVLATPTEPTDAWLKAADEARARLVELGRWDEAAHVGARAGAVAAAAGDLEEGAERLGVAAADAERALHVNLARRLLARVDSLSSPP